VGGSYFATVVAIKDFGAFLELDGGHQGMVHISEISHNKVDFCYESRFPHQVRGQFEDIGSFFGLAFNFTVGP
jgi:polyribonucleotide nucleotidyltransferase